MTEAFDQAELEAVAVAMRAFESRCDEIMSLIGEKRTLSRWDRSEIELRYRSLKEDIKAAAKHGTVSGQRRPRNRSEECFYFPAVMRAAVDLRPATNSHPITSGWIGALFEARSEFSYYLHNMGKAAP